MRRTIGLVLVVFAGCGAAVAPVGAVGSVAPLARVGSVAADPTLSPSPPETCIDAPSAAVLSCDGVAPPTRSWAEVATADASRRAPAAPRGSGGRRGRRGSPEDEFALRPFDPDEAALVHAFRAERCARPPTDPERATITYRLARLYYDANAFRTAAVLFDEVARDPLAGEVGPYAAQLALDSLNVRLRQVEGDARTECLARFAASVDAYAARWCVAPIQEEELCATLEQLRQQVGTALAQ